MQLTANLLIPVLIAFLAGLILPFAIFFLMLHFSQ